MITDTIQNALKRLFCSIGGNADNVRNKDDINAILDEMTALGLGEEIKNATEIPEVKSTDKGKFLHANGSSGKLEWDSVPSELPSVGSTDKDKYLHTNSSTGALEWTSVTGKTPMFVDPVSSGDDEYRISANDWGMMQSYALDGRPIYCQNPFGNSNAEYFLLSPTSFSANHTSVSGYSGVLYDSLSGGYLAFARVYSNTGYKLEFTWYPPEA